MRGNMREIEVNRYAVRRIYSLWGGGSAKQMVGASGSLLISRADQIQRPTLCLGKEAEISLGFSFEEPANLAHSPSLQATEVVHKC